MDYVWIVLGIVILVLAFLEAFIVVLNYDERGIVVAWLGRWQWLMMRAITRRVSPRRRPMVLRQVTGVLLLTMILTMLSGIMLGFTFIYLGLIGLGYFELSEGTDPDFLGALYLSMGQFATVGADNISPGGGWVNLIPVFETLTSIVMLSFIITFLSNIYGVIQMLRSLCADFFGTGPGVGSPIEALRPYFPDGESRNIDRHLDELVGDFNLYCDSLRQDNAAYYFQSGDDQFSLPFALHMTSGVVGALRWGLPTGSDASKAPSLPRLIEAFNGFRDRRYGLMRWRRPVVPEPVAPQQFADAFAAYRAGSADDSVSARSAIDPWVLRFLALNDEMSAMSGGGVPTDVDDAYGRYTEWLAFAYLAGHFVAAVSRDLDYQPSFNSSISSPGASTTPIAIRN